MIIFCRLIERLIINRVTEGNSQDERIVVIPIKTRIRRNQRASLRKRSLSLSLSLQLSLYPDSKIQTPLPLGKSKRGDIESSDLVRVLEGEGVQFKRLST